MRCPTAARARRQRGHLLLWAAVFGLLAMASWAIAFRATHDQIRIERAAAQSARDDAPSRRALAAAIALLRTGSPPSSPYACIVTLPGAPARRATFTRAETDGEWVVEVRPAGSADESQDPAAPASF